MATPYPYAAAPDILRSHQKDASLTTHLATTLTDIHHRLLGARSAHAHAPELRALSSLLYFSLTTLPGNRTLGEEYCDIVQVTPSGSLPNLRTRAAYLLAAILLPYLASRCRPRLRALLERLRARAKPASRAQRAWAYLASANAAPLHAVSLALFYFSGKYYELPKRLLSLRYVFTRNVAETDRAGYEVLGALLAIQLGVQGYLHVRGALLPSPPQASTADAASTVDMAAVTRTPSVTGARFNLLDAGVMGYIHGAQQRKCTLCLEAMRDPAATQCGHVFCWECIGDWVREKPECPLCRREAMVQHILPLRVV